MCNCGGYPIHRHQHWTPKLPCWWSRAVQDICHAFSKDGEIKVFWGSYEDEGNWNASICVKKLLSPNVQPDAYRQTMPAMQSCKSSSSHAPPLCTDYPSAASRQNCSDSSLRQLGSRHQTSNAHLQLWSLPHGIVAWFSHRSSRCLFSVHLLCFWFRPLGNQWCFLLGFAPSAWKPFLHRWCPWPAYHCNTHSFTCNVKGNGVLRSISMKAISAQMVSLASIPLQYAQLYM